MHTLMQAGWRVLCGTTGLRKSVNFIAAMLLVASWLACCHHADPAAATTENAALVLSSTSVQDGRILKLFTCDGAESSPQLAWTAPPQATKTFALIVTDPDAPIGTFVHWVLYNMPAAKRELAAGLAKQDQLDDGSRQGRNDFGKTGYGGPCPPSGTHRYVFSLYALDTALNLPPGATRKQVEEAMKGHVLARGELTARYGR